MSSPAQPACFPLTGSSPAIRRVCDWVCRVAPSDAVVLLTGEPGTGKDLVAQLIHDHSGRREHPMVRLDCSAMAEKELAAALFGERLDTLRPAAGTLFLDEVSALPAVPQGRLVHALEAMTAAHPRIIASSARDLRAMAANGQFRDDLFYRLSVVPIHLPALRERIEDLPALIEVTFERLRPRLGGKTVTAVSPAALERLRAHSWPGNVRELESVIEFACICAAGESIELADLPESLRSVPACANGSALHSRVEDTERETLESVLRQSSTAAEAAQLLGVSRATLFRKARRYGLTIGAIQSHD